MSILLAEAIRGMLSRVPPGPSVCRFEMGKDASARKTGIVFAPSTLSSNSLQGLYDVRITLRQYRVKEFDRDAFCSYEAWKCIS